MQYHFPNKRGVFAHLLERDFFPVQILVILRRIEIRMRMAAQYHIDMARILYQFHIGIRLSLPA